jgi:hypothetical protein
MLPWFYFCKVIAFDWSSTDNLNELIAQDGDYGLSGGVYLYLLVGLISILAGCLAWTIANGNSINNLVLFVVLVISIVPGWQLINAGLTGNVGKYGLNFSGVDFLLGPDRSHLLSSNELFLRWAFIQFFTTVGLGFGGLLYLKWIGPVYNGQTLKASTKTRVTAPMLSELLISFEFDQIKFINELAIQLDKDISSTVSLIISFLKEEMDGSQNLQEYIYNEIKTKANGQSNLTTLPVLLPSNLMKFITMMQVNIGIDSRQVVCQLINFFMMTSRLKAEN